MIPKKRYRLRKFRLSEVSVVDAPAEENSRISVFKRRDGPAGSKGDGTMADGATDKDLLDQARTALETANAERDAAVEKAKTAEAALADTKAKLEKAEANIAKGKGEPADEFEGMSETAIEKVKAERARTAKIEKQLAEITREREIDALKAEVAKSYSKLPVAADEVAEILKAAIDKLEDKQVETLRQILKAANGAMEQATLTLGHREIITSAEKQIEELAKKRASEQNITIAKAKVDVLNANPELYSRYLDERGQVQ